MKSSFKPYWAQLISLSIMATVAVGCGKKKSDDSSDSITLDTEISSVEPAADGKTVTVSYRDKNDNKDVGFKCLVEENGAKAEWSDCDAAGLIVDVKAAAKYKFSVKAVSGTTEDATPATRLYVASGSADAGTGAETQKISALILNKADVGATYTKSSLTLNFGVNASVNLDEVRFEYKVNDGQWTRVQSGGNDSDTLKLDSLEDSQTYAVSVRAIYKPTNAIGGEDTLTFKTSLNTLAVTATPDLATAKSGKLQLSIVAAQGQIASIACALDGAAAGACDEYVPSLNLDVMQSGSHRLIIQAMDASGKSLGSTSVNFCAQACSVTGGGAGAPAQPMVQIMQLGDFYTLRVPEGMHVTEYATTKNYTGGTTGQLEFFRIRTNSDPFYIGNYKCDGLFDQIISYSSPSRSVYDYCYSTFPRTNNEEYYKWLTSYGLANNHIEIATDADQVTEETHERIVMNVFDRDFEFMHGRSRFEQLCMNARGSIVQTPNITVMNDFWTERVKARMLICRVTFNGGLGGLNPDLDRNTWWVASFFIDSNEENLPRNECFWNDWQSDLKYGNPVDYHPEFCGNFKNPSLLEAVYISNRNWTGPEWFAQAAQGKLVGLLKELTPVIPVLQ